MSDLKNRALNDEALDAVSGGECTDGRARSGDEAWQHVNSQIRGGGDLAFGIDEQQGTGPWLDYGVHRKNVEYSEFQRMAIALYQTNDGTDYSPLSFGY